MATTVTLSSHPAHAAGGLRLMARFLSETIVEASAGVDRLTEAADDMEALLADAGRLDGPSPTDRYLQERIDQLRAIAAGKRSTPDDAKDDR